jgi:predicted transcriptional regulator
LSYEETLEKVYNALSFEPQTPNEIAEKIDLNQHTVQVALLELMNIEKNIKWRKIGMYRLFWQIKWDLSYKKIQRWKTFEHTFE